MLFDGWYTDLVDIYRVQNGKSGNVTRQERVKQNPKGIPCRICSSRPTGPSMPKGAAKTENTEILNCSVDTDIKPGDELKVVRGGNLGKQNEQERYFAGKPQVYYDPVGGILSGLEHMEVAIFTDEIIK